MRVRNLPGTRMTLFLLVVVPLLSSPVIAAGSNEADDPTPSNLDLMTTLGTEVVEEIISSIQSQMVGKGVRLKPLANAEQYRFLDNLFTKTLKERGIKIYGAPGLPGQASPERQHTSPLILEYETLEFSLAYERVYRSFLIGGKRVKRRADLKVLAKLVDNEDAEVMWIGEQAAGHSDQFSFGNVRRIESGTFQFTKPARPSAGWGKLVEPVFVSGIIVGMIYLFFQNQSDN